MDNAANSLTTALMDTGDIDTVYRDVYVRRARALLELVLPEAEFEALGQQRAALAGLPARIAHALEAGDWDVVKELSQRADVLKHAVNDGAARLDVARRVYEAPHVRLDPFSPGLQPFTGIPAREWPALGTRALELLDMLARHDPDLGQFYAARRRAFQARRDTASLAPQRDEGVMAPADPLDAARQALKAGDMKRLAALADTLGAASRRGSSQSSPAAGSERPVAGLDSCPELQPVVHSTETLTRARRLGLAPRHMEPRKELASLRQYAWTPWSDERGHAEPARLALPSGAPPTLRDGLAVFMTHPLVNSGGARYLPGLLAEDVLVEDFLDPVDGQAPSVSDLLKGLGLSRRAGVPRVVIEQALLLHGARILDEELGLDPHVFRLVCIPPDVYARLGEAEGWGRQPFWTHFDGYLIRRVDGHVRLQALAGGDVRYGGLYDLLAVGRDYDSDHLLTRLAVVQRARMVAW